MSEQYIIPALPLFFCAVYEIMTGSVQRQMDERFPMFVHFWSQYKATGSLPPSGTPFGKLYRQCVYDRMAVAIYAGFMALGAVARLPWSLLVPVAVVLVGFGFGAAAQILKAQGDLKSDADMNLLYTIYGCTKGATYIVAALLVLRN